jgi:pimeloyl-ACP methyl ester carboxylesterase
MVALYRSGRQADALSAYQRARGILREELGLEPGGELHRIERAILQHDASLELPDTGTRVSTDQTTPATDGSPVQYALTDDGVHVAYQVYGAGPIDLLVVPAFVCHLDLWREPPVDQLVHRLATRHRLIIFDKRGSGLSDRPVEISADRWVLDARAVLDAAGSRRAVVLGMHCGAPIAAMLAAAHPHRTSALVLYGTSPRIVNGDGYSLGSDQTTIDSYAQYLSVKWGLGGGLAAFAPGSVNDPSARAFWARYQHLSASPDTAARVHLVNAAVDVRSTLPTVAAPTLVVHAARDAVVPAAAGRLMAELIPDASYCELDSDAHLLWFSDVISELTDTIESFIARVVAAPDAEAVVATIMHIAEPHGTRRDRNVTALVERHKGRLQSPVGTAVFDRPGQAIRCALELTRQQGACVAIHTGECELHANGDISGKALDIASQLAGCADRGQVLVTGTVRDLLIGSDINFEHHSQQHLDPTTRPWDVHTVQR